MRPTTLSLTDPRRLRRGLATVASISLCLATPAASQGIEGMPIVGYADRLSVAQGETIRFGQLPGAPVSCGRRAPDPRRHQPRRAAPLLMGGYATGRADDSVGGHFNGRIENPRVFDRVLSPDELEALKDGEPPTEPVAAWDFSAGISTREVSDTSSNRLHGRAMQRPTRGVTGHNWTGQRATSNGLRHNTRRFTSTTTTWTTRAGTWTSSTRFPRPCGAGCMPSGCARARVPQVSRSLFGIVKTH